MLMPKCEYHMITFQNPEVLVRVSNSAILNVYNIIYIQRNKRHKKNAQRHNFFTNIKTKHIETCPTSHSKKQIKNKRNKYQHKTKQKQIIAHPILNEIVSVYWLEYSFSKEKLSKSLGQSLRSRTSRNAWFSYHFTQKWFFLLYSLKFHTLCKQNNGNFFKKCNKIAYDMCNFIRNRESFFW